MKEPCVGCDHPSSAHPFVAIMWDEGGWAAFPVCEPCWRDPTHRRRKLKAHFFTREERERALAMAGSSSIGTPGPPKKR